MLQSFLWLLALNGLKENPPSPVCPSTPYSTNGKGDHNHHHYASPAATSRLCGLIFFRALYFTFQAQCTRLQIQQQIVSCDAAATTYKKCSPLSGSLNSMLWREKGCILHSFLCGPEVCFLIRSSR